MGQERDEALYARILDRLGPVREVLDVGCGEGRLVAYLAERAGIHGVGVDISPEGFVRAGEDTARRQVAHLTACVQGDAQEMPIFADGQFEAVTMTFTLHHIEGRDHALRKIHRVLRPGGKVLVGDYVIVEGRHSSECHRFTVAQVQRMLEEAGFVRVDVEMVEPAVALVVAEKA